MKIRQDRWSSFKNIALCSSLSGSVGFIGSFVLPVCGSALFAWFAIQFPVPHANGAGYPTPTPNCSATPSQTGPPIVDLPTCSATASPYPPQVVEIPDLYQAPDGARLGWGIYLPPGPTPTPAPGVIVIHGGGWSTGNALQISGVAQYIAAAGYHVVSVEYELARCGLIPGQPPHDQDYNGTLPDMVTRQTNDIKAIVNALRADSRCNGKVGVVGGSSGATHAVWVALDTTDSGNNGTVWPFWKADKRPDCAVMLSAAYDFSDRTP
jgi:acetyl esterase/lipase